jgi:hypothetical protein
MTQLATNDTVTSARKPAKKAGASENRRRKRPPKKPVATTVRPAEIAKDRGFLRHAGSPLFDRKIRFLVSTDLNFATSVPN